MATLRLYERRLSTAMVGNSITIMTTIERRNLAGVLGRIQAKILEMFADEGLFFNWNERASMNTTNQTLYVWIGVIAVLLFLVAF